MKKVVLLLLSIHLVGCTPKEKKEVITHVANDSMAIEEDSVRHEVPDCYGILAIETLQPNLTHKKITMGTEKPIYSTTMKHLTIWVDNHTDMPLVIGRDWSIEFWNGKKWTVPTMKKNLFWLDDARAGKEIHIRYYFTYPIGEYYVLKEGKYRIAKKFVQEKSLIQLYADFEVK